MDFRESLYPTGNVEDWMGEIERIMKESLRLIIKDSLEDYKKVWLCVCVCVCYVSVCVLGLESVSVCVLGSRWGLSQ